MPFDGTVEAYADPATPVKAATPDLAYLSYVLKHREQWPENFKFWDYASFDHCAVGLTQCIWPGQPENNSTVAEEAAAWFGISEPVAYNIFIGAAHHYPGLYMVNVRPEHVAALIDKYLIGALENKC